MVRHEGQPGGVARPGDGLSCSTVVPCPALPNPPGDRRICQRDQVKVVDRDLCTQGGAPRGCPEPDPVWVGRWLRIGEP